MPILQDIDASGSEMDQDHFQEISPSGISIPSRTLVQSSFTTRKVIHHASPKYEDTPRCLGLACDGSYLACGYDSGRFEVLLIHSFIPHKFWVVVRFERLSENGKSSQAPRLEGQLLASIGIPHNQESFFSPPVEGMFILSSSRVQRSNIFYKFVLASTLNFSYDHQSQGDFVEDLITFDGYITGIAIHENGSQLASPFMMTKWQMFFLS